MISLSLSMENWQALAAQNNEQVVMPPKHPLLF
jgi:hypothetical protein